MAVDGITSAALAQYLLERAAEGGRVRRDPAVELGAAVLDVYRGDDGDGHRDLLDRRCTPF